MRRRAFLVGAPLALAACGAAEPVWAPDEVVSSKVYRHDGPPALTLFTMKNAGSDNGAHTGLMVNASQRVIFDPAGTFGHPTIPERNDVHYGITPAIEDFYVRYHARATYYIHRQDLEVTRAQAEAALRAVQDYGAVPKAMCTIATARVLRQVPGFEDIRPGLFPDSLLDQFARYPGVRSSVHRENDSPDKAVALAEFDAQVARARTGQIEPAGLTGLTGLTGRTGQVTPAR